MFCFISLNALLLCNTFVLQIQHSACELVWTLTKFIPSWNMVWSLMCLPAQVFLLEQLLEWQVAVDWLIVLIDMVVFVIIIVELFITVSHWFIYCIDLHWIVLHWFIWNVCNFIGFHPIVVVVVVVFRCSLRIVVIFILFGFFSVIVIIIHSSNPTGVVNNLVCFFGKFEAIRNFIIVGHHMNKINHMLDDRNRNSIAVCNSSTCTEM